MTDQSCIENGNRKIVASQFGWDLWSIKKWTSKGPIWEKIGFYESGDDAERWVSRGT